MTTATATATPRNRQSVPIKHDTSPIELPTGLEFQKGETNRKILRAVLKACGTKPRFPLDTKTAFVLLRLMGYQINRPMLDYHLKKGYISSPKKDGREFLWTEEKVIELADSLESTRNWLPLHPCHRHKLDANEFAKHTLEVAKNKMAIEAFTEMHPLELIGLLVDCENQSTREMLGFALKIKTGLIHIKGAESVPDYSPAMTN